MKPYDVHLFVCPSICPAESRFAAVGSAGKRYRSTAAAAAWLVNAGSATLSAYSVRR